MTTAVIFGGPSAEHDISILTGLQAARTLSDAGDDVIALYWQKDLTWKQVPVTAEPSDFLRLNNGWDDLSFSTAGGFAASSRFRSKPISIDAVLNCCHGGPGEDGSLAGQLQQAGYRVSGPGPTPACVAMDKLATEAIAASIGIPTLTSALWFDNELLGDPPPQPWIVKPRFGGSSLGIEKGVTDLDTVAALARQGVGAGGLLIQEYRDGWVDLNVSVRTYPSLQLSAIERPIKPDSDILTFSDKYLAGGGEGMASARRELPADIPDGIAKSIEDGARRLVQAIGLTGAPRVDFLWDGADTVLLCEVNPVPGSWAFYLWNEIGISRADLLRGLLDEAKKSPRLPAQWTGSSDGAALRASDSIASKLR